MNATLTKSLGLLAAWAALLGCDTIEMPVPAAVTSTLSAAEQQALDAREQQLPAPPNEQRAFLEDFTGQFCGNCPRAGAIAVQLKTQYGECLVAVEEHETDFFAAPKAYAPYQVDYRVPVVSQEIEKAFGAGGPAQGRGEPAAGGGLVVGGAGVCRLGCRRGGAAGQSPAAGAAPDAPLRQHHPRAEAESSQPLPRSSAQPPLPPGCVPDEDNLVGGQKDYDRPAGQQDITNYAHRHVLRAALAGTFGTLQVTNPLRGQAFASYLAYTLPASATNAARTQWKASNVAVVAYLADDATKEIVQTVEVKLQ